MFGKYFYWSSLRRTNAVFGSLFNNISVQRVDADGNPVKKFKVPLEQAQKEGYLVRLREEEKKEGTPGIGITLPRMSYEFAGMAYRAEDKTQTSRYMRSQGEGDSTAIKMFNPVPYDVNFNLNIYSKHMDDAFQILEQILPFFGPSLGITINEIPELGLKNDIEVQLDGFDTNVEHEGSVGDYRLIVWTLNFRVMTRIYHPTSNPGVIKKTIQNMEFGDLEESKLAQIITHTVNPITADENDVYTIDFMKEEF